MTKPVTLKEKRQLIKELIVNAAHCTMLSKRDVVVIKAIRKDVLARERTLKKIRKIRNPKFPES